MIYRRGRWERRETCFSCVLASPRHVESGSATFKILIWWTMAPHGLPDLVERILWLCDLCGDRSLIFLGEARLLLHHVIWCCIVQQVAFPGVN